MAIVNLAPPLPLSIWIGFDPNPCEAAAFAVARFTVQRLLTAPIPIRGLVLADLQAYGIYTRPMATKVNAEGRVEMVDLLSVRPDYDGRISTQHANARFLVPHLAQSGWALFMDGDMLVRGNLARLFDQLDRRFAVYCVKHRHEPEAPTKMDGQQQTRYTRKNWSSFIVFNCDHPSNRALTLEMVNTLPGRDLHRLCWLKDDEIGELAEEWNYLVGHSDPSIEPKVVHFTSGTPNMAGYEGVQFAPLWRDALNDWARGAMSLPG